MRKWPFFALGIPLLVALYNVDVYTGSRKLDRLCKTEAGVRVHEPLQRDFGWLVDQSSSTAESYATELKDYVAFVRFRDEKGHWIDVRHVGYVDVKLPTGGTHREWTYERKPANQLVQPRYAIRNTSGRELADTRFIWSRDEVIEISTGKVVTEAR
jgi:hypothetical protein